MGNQVKQDRNASDLNPALSLAGWSMQMGEAAQENMKRIENERVAELHTALAIEHCRSSILKTEQTLKTHSEDLMIPQCRMEDAHNLKADDLGTQLRVAFRSVDENLRKLALDSLRLTGAHG